MPFNSREAFAIEIPHDAIERFCGRFGVAEFSLFGSVVRADFTAHSDVDVMLKFKPGHGFTFENTPEIDDELRQMFGRPVDVIELENIRNPLRRRAILDSCKVVYGT